VQEVGEQLLRAATEIIGAEGTSVWLWDSKREGWLACRAISYAKDRSLLDLRLRPGQGVGGWAAQREQSVIVNDVSSDPRFFPGIDEKTGFHTRSMAAAPLRARGKVIGVLEVVNKLNGEFDAGDLALVETLAASAAIAIDNAQLVETLRKHAVDLEISNEELDAFAHTVAHDLKGPLGYMVGFAQVLALDYATLSNDKVVECLNTVVQSGLKISSIIDELLLLASVRKLEEMEMGPMDMSSIVAEAQGRLFDLIDEYGGCIVLPEIWPMALGYGPWVEEVWVNYLSNALKYGGRPPRVELGADQLPDQPTIRFWVRDNGSGLTPEEQERLFTLFTRLDKVRAKGHGLGLSIVRRIVEKLGGEVGVESHVGQGSVFWFTLPSLDALQLLD
jgi:signal transduction histidine kinase